MIEVLRGRLSLRVTQMIKTCGTLDVLIFIMNPRLSVRSGELTLANILLERLCSIETHFQLRLGEGTVVLSNGGCM